MSWFKSKEERLESKIAKTARKLCKAEAEEGALVDMVNSMSDAGKVPVTFILDLNKWRVAKEVLQYDLSELIDEKEALEFGKLLGSVK